MSAIRSASQPTLSYQVDPLLNVSPLIDLYSDCLTHVADTDGLFHLQAHKSPIVLSKKRADSNWTPSYQKGFARVRSPQCLLTIGSLFFSWKYVLKPFRDYIIPQGFLPGTSEANPTSDFAVLYPQSFIILTNRRSGSFNFYEHCDDYTGMPLVFILQLNDNVNSFPRISGALSYDVFKTLSFHCSTFESCGKEMEVKIRTFAKLFQTSWKFDSYKGGHGGHPFRRGTPAGIIEAMASFIIAPKDQRNEEHLLCHPSFGISHWNFPSRLKESLLVGRTASVKFVTTAGVFTPQSSYRVYFSPFLPAVWLGILISAGACFVVMVGSFQMQSQRVDIGLLSFAAVMTHWIFATAIGQNHHSDIQVVLGRTSRNVVRIVAPVVVSWFILSTFIVNVYSAIFSSDATRSFYYLTNYTDYIQLPIDAIEYILFNESYLKQNQWAIDTEEDKCTRGDHWEDICFQGTIPTACDIGASIWPSLEKLAGQTKLKISEQQRSLIDQRLKLWDTGARPSMACANIETLSRLLRSEKPLVFLMADHDFQKYWKLFVKIMQRDPTIKVANNFYSDSSFLSQPVRYQFTSGRHPTFKGSVVARMKILLSSGIYGLWEKWHRIKFTDGGLQHAEKKLPPVNRVDPLSFDNSGTTWVFQAQAVVWLAATVTLVAEIITEYLPSGWC